MLRCSFQLLLDNMYMMQFWLILSRQCYIFSCKRNKKFFDGRKLVSELNPKRWTKIQVVAPSKNLQRRARFGHILESTLLGEKLYKSQVHLGTTEAQRHLSFLFFLSNRGQQGIGFFNLGYSNQKKARRKCSKCWLYVFNVHATLGTFKGITFDCEQN